MGLVGSWSLLNRDTGEVTEKEFEEKKTKRAKDRDWVSSKMDWLETAARAPIQGNDLRILLLLFARCTWNNQVHVKRKELADALGVQYSQIGTALKALERERFVYCDRDDNASFAVNPMLCWRGNPATRTSACFEFERLFCPPPVVP